jgi:transposase
VYNFGIASTLKTWFDYVLGAGITSSTPKVAPWACLRASVPLIRMLILGYAFGLWSERLLCREVRVNLACRWFCGLSIEDKIPDHSVFLASPQ